jgi:hypothetical protein
MLSVPAQTVVSTLVTLIIGALLLFYGYPLFRVLLPLAGLVFGYYFGQSLFPGQPAYAFVAAIALALLFALLSYTAWAVVIAVSGVLIGFGFGTQLGLALGLGLDRNTVVIVGVVFAILIGLLAYRARDLMVMGQTALVGASAILFGIGAIYEPLNVINARTSANTLALIALIALAAIGFFFQYGRFGTRRIYYRRR